MKLRLTFLFCTLTVALPAVAASSSTGGPQWGALPVTKKPRFHGECCYTDPARQPAPHHTGPTTGRMSKGGVCNLAGAWRSSPYSKAWGNMQLSVLKRNGPTLIQYRVQLRGIRGEAHEVISYNANKHTVQEFAYARPNIFIYGKGTVSRDCRHMSFNETYNDFATRNLRVNFIRR